MRGSSKNRVRGKAREIKGKAKETVGRMRRDPELAGEGLDDQIAGRVQNIAGRIQKKLED
jgi:uncharacterized protein YjbJ (UPF0337 family)